MNRSGFTWDFIVVGGGLEGLSLAYHLAKFKAKVLLIEKRSIGDPHAALHSSTFRLQYTAPENARFAVEGRKTLKKVAGEVKAKNAVHETGIIWLLDVRTARKFKRWNVALWERLGAGVRITEARPVAGLEATLNLQAWEYMASTDVGGIVDLTMLSEALAQAAKKRGAVIAEGTEVYSVEHNGEKVLGVIVERYGLVRAKNVILAAGAWTKKLMEGAGLSIPLTPKRACSLFFESPGLIAERPIWAPPVQGLLVQTAGWLRVITRSGDGESFETRLSYTCLRNGIRVLDKIITGGSWLLLEAARAHVQPVSPDRSPLIGRSEFWPEGLYVLTGFSGHGACFRVHAGLVLAKLLVEGEMPKEAKPYNPDRFTKGEIISESLSF